MEGKEGGKGMSLFSCIDYEPVWMLPNLPKLQVSLLPKLSVGDAEKRPQGNTYEAPTRARDLHQYHDHQHIRRPFLQKGIASLKGNVHQTFINTMTIYTFVVCFVARKGSPAQRRSPGSAGGPSDVHWSRAHRGIPRPPEVTSHRRSPRLKPPNSGHVLAYDWQDMEIIVNIERS
jgi:hypothetical protein